MLVTKIILVLIVLLFISGYVINSSLAAKVNQSLAIGGTDHFGNGKFHNTAPQNPLPFKDGFALWLRFFIEEKIDTTPDIDIPVRPISQADLAALSNDTLHIIKLGHSSILLKINGEYWLIDPVFADRASPFNFVGPKRFHQPPISLADLPPIDKVLISHNHYDHLDKGSIKLLDQKTQAFFVPKGVDGDLELWGIDPNKITTFDWCLFSR